MAGRPSPEHTPFQFYGHAQGFAKAVALHSHNGYELSSRPDPYAGPYGAYDPARLLVLSLDGARAELRGYFS